MGAQQIQLQGQIVVGDPNCGGCSSPGTLKSQGMALRCGSTWFDAIVGTDVPMQVATAGLVGAAWAELPTTEALDAVELLLVRSNAPMALRVGADGARLLGESASFPTGFAGGETLDLEIDAAPVSVVFTSGAQTAQQVVNQINAAAALAGMANIARVVGGQVEIYGQATGVQGSVTAEGTALSDLGLGAEAVGSGEDTYFNGLFLVEYGRGQLTAPNRVQISGAGQIEVFAAGTPA